MIVACQKPIARLLASCPGVDQVVVEGSLLPEFAVYAPLMSLPLIFGTTLELGAAQDSLPDSRRRARSAEWRADSGSSAAFKIGVAWQGNPDIGAIASVRSAWPSSRRLARTPGVELVSLQGIHGLEQLGEVESRFAVTRSGRTIVTTSWTSRRPCNRSTW